MAQLTLAAPLPILLAIGPAFAQDIDAEPADVPLSLETPLLPTIVIRGEPLPPAEERTLGARLEQLGVPGVSVALFHDGRIQWAEGFGLADVESGRPVTATTLFQAASISKPLAAMGAMCMVEAGHLTLDGDVNAQLESWKVPTNALTDPNPGERHAVTLRDLLSHTAGLTVHGFPGYPRSAPLPSTVAVLDGEGNTDPVRVDLTPGTTRRYSGGGYTVAQLLMTDVDPLQRDFATLMGDSVLAPLGMSASTFAQPLPVELHPRAATAYDWDGAAVPGSWHVYPEQAAAGLWSTPTDLARFALAVQRGLAGEDGAVLSAAGVRQLCTAPVEPGYGLGLSLGRNRFGHGGANMGFRCVLTALNRGGGVAIMTNSDAGWPLLDEIQMTLFEHYGWEGPAPREMTVIAVTREELERFVGEYEIAGWGTVSIAVADAGDRLAVTSPEDGTFILRAQSELVFFDPIDGLPIEFVLDDSGAVSGFEWDGTVATRVDAKAR